MEHHRLDPYPIPKERTPLYVNEPWLADKTLLELPPNREPDKKEGKGQILRPTPNTAPLICGACYNTQPEDLLTMA